MVYAGERCVTRILPISDDRGRFVIVFVILVCYVDVMGRSFEHELPVRHASGVRRSMLILLAFVYLFVGVAHNIACMDQVVASDGFTISKVSDSGDGGDSGGMPSVCDHCPTCTPGVMPLQVVATSPVAVPVQRNDVAMPMLMSGHPRLDTPPPKILI
jgi:hypothetical protein